MLDISELLIKLFSALHPFLDSGCTGNKTANTNEGCVYNCKTYFSPIEICRISHTGRISHECMCKDGYVWEREIRESNCILPQDCTESDIRGLYNYLLRNEHPLFVGVKICAF